MACGSSVDKLEIQLMDVGNKLLHLPSSTIDIINLLVQVEKVLSTVQQPPSEAIIKALPTISNALFAKELVRHPYMNVSILVACCICEVLRIMEPDLSYNHKHMKEFFKLVVMLFEKLSYASGGCYTKMTKVLEIFSKARFPILMLDVQVEGLVGRLFKQFLNAADSNSSAIVLEMEKIMTMIIKESDELALELQSLIITIVDKVNQIASPVCWQLGEKVLMNCAPQLKPHLQSMGWDVAKETILCTSETSKLKKDTADKIKVECLEENVNLVQTLRHCQHASRDKVKLLGIQSEDGNKTVSFDDPPMPSESVTEVKGKRKRNDTQGQALRRKVSYSVTRVQGYKVKKHYAPILEAIYKKHGDIASECVIKTAVVRESILEAVCEVVRRIQTNDVTTIISDMGEIEKRVLDAEATKINVAWLRADLEAIHKRNEAQKKSKLLMEMKSNTSSVKRAANLDLEERQIELLTAQEQVEKAERCVKVLDLLEKNLNDHLLESKAENDAW